VTPLVKPVNPPRTPEAKPETLLTTDAAKEEPGIFGMDTLGREPPMDGIEDVLTVEVDGRGIDGS
jgi:hypothetical protein